MPSRNPISTRASNRNPIECNGKLILLLLDYLQCESSVPHVPVRLGFKAMHSIYKCYNRTSDQCDFDRYIVEDASTGLGVCPNHTYWNGMLCVNQVYLGSPCSSNAWCRADVLLRCVNISGMTCQAGNDRDETHSVKKCDVRLLGFEVNLIINGDAETGPCESGISVTHPTSWNYTGLVTQIRYTNYQGALPSAVSKPR